MAAAERGYSEALESSVCSVVYCVVIVVQWPVLTQTRVESEWRRCSSGTVVKTELLSADSG